MATYIPNIKDYIPKTEAYAPDFKFISDALATRQDRYDKNLNQLNNLYGQVVYADLSRADNRSVRDQYAKELAPRIQQVTGLDFSLAQNVDAAQALFKPFYDDPKLVRDLVFTKQYKNEMKKAQTYKDSPDQEANAKYWQDGVKYMNYQLDDFINATRDESMSKPLPVYYRNPDLYNRAMEVLTTGGPDGKGFKGSNMYIDQTGNFIVTQENGIEILSKPTGAMIPNPNFDSSKPESKNNPKVIPEMYNPAGNHIRFSLGKDPVIQQGMQIMGFVAARDWAEANKEKYNGDLNAAQNAWADMMITKYKLEEEKNIETGEKELNKLNKTANNWQEYVKNTPLIEMSDEYKSWLQTIAARGTLQKGLDEAKSNVDFVTQEAKDDRDRLNKAMTAYVYDAMQGEIFRAAQNYADLTSVREIEENKFALEKYKQDRLDQRERLKARIKAEDEQKRRSFNPFDLNQFQIPGNANENAIFLPRDEDGNPDFISQNRKEQTEVLGAIQESELSIIKKFYQRFADSLNNDTDIANQTNLSVTPQNKEMGEFSSAGLFVPTGDKLVFYSWDDAGVLLEKNPKFIEKHFDYINGGLNNYAKVFPNLQSDDMLDFMGDIQNQMRIHQNLNTRYDIAQEELKTVYKNVIEKTGVLSNSNLAGFDFENDPVDFLDEYGNIRTVEEIVNERKNLVLDKILPLLPAEIPSLEESVNASVNGTLENSTSVRNQQTGQQYSVPNSFVKVLEDRYGKERITPDVIDAQWRSTPAFGMQSYYVANELEPLAIYLASVGVDPRTNSPMQLAQTYYVPSERGNTMSAYTRRDQAKGALQQDLVGPFNELQEVIGNMHTMINKEMSSVNAVPGQTSMNFGNRFYGREDAGDGAIANGLTYGLDESMNPAAVNEMLKIFDIAKRLPQGIQGQMVLVGDFGNAYRDDLLTILGDEDKQKGADWWKKNYNIIVPSGTTALKGQEVLKQINQDLNVLYSRGPSAFSKGEEPVITIESFPYGGGKGAGGNQLMKKIILSEGYSQYLEEILSDNIKGGFKIPENTITVFANREMYKDESDPTNQYLSGVGFRINAPGSNGQDMINIDRGGQLIFQKSNGIYYVKEALYTYDGTNYSLGSFTQLTPLVKQNGLPFSEQEVDAYYTIKYNELVDKAKSNLQYSNSDKTVKNAQNQ